MQFDGSEFILFAASTNLEYQNRSKLAISNKMHFMYTQMPVVNSDYKINSKKKKIRLQNCTISHMSGDGFPIVTSSPPTIATKDSSHPIYHM
jgi:hypothetical protein